MSVASSEKTREKKGSGFGETVKIVIQALLLALIAVVCIAAVTLLGNSVGTRLSTTGGSLGTGS